MSKILQRFGASAIRHFAVVVGTLQVGAMTDLVSASFWQQVALAVGGGLVGPAIRALTETADLIDPDQ